MVFNLPLSCPGCEFSLFSVVFFFRSSISFLPSLCCGYLFPSRTQFRTALLLMTFWFPCWCCLPLVWSLSLSDLDSHLMFEIWLPVDWSGFWPMPAWPLFCLIAQSQAALRHVVRLHFEWPKFEFWLKDLSWSYSTLSSTSLHASVYCTIRYFWER